MKPGSVVLEMGALTTRPTQGNWDDKTVQTGTKLGLVWQCVELYGDHYSPAVLIFHSAARRGRLGPHHYF